VGARSRLLWRCRRGIREMDLLLRQFVERYYPDLDPEVQQQFEYFLEETDLDILAWIMGRAEPGNPAYRTIIEQLRQINAAQPPQGN